MPSAAWLADLSDRHRNIAQFSSPLPVVAETLEDAVAMVTNRMLVDPDQAARGLTRWRGVSALREQYRKLGLREGSDFVRGPHLRAGGSEGTVDFAVKNGRVVQLAHAWSFGATGEDALIERVGAWAWSLGRLRSGGGTLLTHDDSIPIDGGVELDVLVIPPSAGRPTRALDDARAVFDALKAREVDYDSAADIAASGAALLQRTRA
jgi:hypothetical protein